MADTLPETLSPEKIAEIKREIAAENAKPLSVAIMGQTGTGKSTLLNALFGANLTVGDVRPTTKVPEAVDVRGASGHAIRFWDMPGIGESAAADGVYLALYREKIIASDVVIWAIHADSRSTLFDAQAIEALLHGTSPDERRLLTSKITFVLTKADLVSRPPWIYFRDGDDGQFVPPKEIRDRLDEKAAYYQESLIRPHGGLSRSQTHYSDDFTITDHRFSYDDHYVTYCGLMDAAACADYQHRFPAYAAVFERLAANQRVVAVSALYRYNLVPLLISIVNRLGDSAIGRFQRLTEDAARLSTVPLDTARNFGNIVVWDKQLSARTFDLADLNR